MVKILLISISMFFFGCFSSVRPCRADMKKYCGMEDDKKDCRDKFKKKFSKECRAHINKKRKEKKK